MFICLKSYNNLLALLAIYDERYGTANIDIV